MLHYILQTIVFQIFFLLIYDLFLKKETFFSWNRAYLLLTATLSVVLPFIKFDSIKAIVPEQFVVKLPEVIIGNTLNNTSVLDAVFIESQPVTESAIANPIFTWSWMYLLYAGMCVAALILVFKIAKLLLLIYKNPNRWKGNLLIIKLLNSFSAFSFFHYIFLGEDIKTEDKQTILEHEAVHARQRHTLDLLLFEAMRIVFWFNPLVYIYQNRITELHEFIADAKAVKHQNKKDYYQNLLTQVFETNSISFINPFFKQSLIKKRIVMLSKTKSKQIYLFKYTLLLPLVFGILMYTSSYAQQTQKVIEVEEVADQELTDAELQKKYYDELVKMKLNKENFFSIHNNFLPKNDKYINTRIEHAKLRAFMKYILNSTQELKAKKGTLTQADIEKNNEMLLKHKTYAEYLEWKQTDEAKRRWENNTKDGVLRLVVDDFSHKTEAEQKRYNKKMKMIKNDDYFHSLLITDGKTTTKMEFETIDSKKISNPNKNTVINVNNVEVPFAVIDQVPLFPGCEDLPSGEQKKCISSNIAKHVNKNFNTDLASSLGLEGRQRINVIFKINKDGDITGVRARASHPALESEAKRVIKTLPKMIPGKHNGKNVTVPYSLPIIFQVQGDSNTKETKEVVDEIEMSQIKRREVLKAKLNSNEVPFAVIENPPVFPGCESGDNASKKKCMSDKIAKFVAKNFNTKIATEKGLEGRQRINVIFKIDTLGNITGVRSRAPHPALEAEAIRVISMLPKMEPGVQRGEKVIVPYSLPIIFQVQGNKKQKPLDVVPFAVVQKTPNFKGCETLKTNEEQKKCTSGKISEFVFKKFNTKLAKKNDLIGSQRVFAIFKIDVNGDIIDVDARASHPKLEEEAKRVVKKLPKMIPGEHDGKKVKVAYSLPIIFKVNE